jgi:hypothetical protein
VQPTPYPDLNAVLAAFVAGVRSALDAGLLGVYLVGSFALGDADEHSDVDFLVACSAELSEPQVVALQALHGSLYDLETPWAQHLEGSYAPVGRLRRLAGAQTPFWYLDNGSRELVPDAHCNTVLVRWVLGRCGVTLAGRSPETLVDPVSAGDLRREAVGQMREYAKWASELGETMTQWQQPYLVITSCRVLATVALGEVLSKRAATEWAAEALAPQWRELIARAQADRRDPWGRVHRAADRALAEQTLAFVDYALEKTRGPA